MFQTFVTFFVGVFVGMCIFINPYTADGVNAWLGRQTPTAQYDFIDARLDAAMRRQIAEDWCLQNPNTVRVCHNATTYSKPVDGRTTAVKH